MQFPCNPCLYGLSAKRPGRHLTGFRTCANWICPTAGNWMTLSWNCWAWPTRTAARPSLRNSTPIFASSSSATRQKEEKAIENKNTSRRKVKFNPAVVAGQIWAEIQSHHPALLRRYEPDFLDASQPFDVYDLPPEGDPSPLQDLYQENAVVFLKGKKKKPGPHSPGDSRTGAFGGPPGSKWSPRPGPGPPRIPRNVSGFQLFFRNFCISAGPSSKSSLPSALPMRICRRK